MSPIRTRAKARKENALANVQCTLNGSVSSSNTHQERKQTIKLSRRRKTTFSIEQGGQRLEILADRTARTNAMRGAKERRLTVAHLPFPNWTSDKDVSVSPTKPTEKSPFKRHVAPRSTPRVRWAQHVRIFSGHCQDTSKVRTPPNIKKYLRDHGIDIKAIPANANANSIHSGLQGPLSRQGGARRVTSKRAGSGHYSRETS
ncbi:hypothetical protein GY45DRAFT_589520 [Cubamyces sp. BRFM 1775]|nr:hypothetical protein GY45DRAFT_589520 [Cubamyces sp. BRFM 1775]